MDNNAKQNLSDLRRSKRERKRTGKYDKDSAIRVNGEIAGCKARIAYGKTHPSGVPGRDDLYDYFDFG